MSAGAQAPAGMVVLEGRDKMVVASRAWLLEPDSPREMAWAEGLVRPNNLHAYILGRYVGAGEANENGHVFLADELRTAAATLVHAPLNMLHRPHEVVGSYVGAELVYPSGGPTSAAEGLGAPVHTNPFIESLAAFWRYYFPEQYAMVRLAHEAGQLAQSMECIPRSLTCLTPGCDRTYPYAGRASDTYCEHLRVDHSPPRRLNRPHFSAGAVIVPPARPAWRRAQVSRVMAATSEADLERLYEQVQACFPGLDAAGWEEAMAALLALVPLAPSPAPRRSRSQSPVTAAGGDTAPYAAMVALYPGAEEAQQLAVAGGLAPEHLHVTLAYLGPDAVNQLDLDALLTVLGHFAAGAAPLDAVVGGLIRFNGGYPAGGEGWPLCIQVDGVDMAEFREDLVDALELVGAGPQSDHGFTPHMTLTYVKTPEDEQAALQLLARGVPAVRLRFGSVVVAWGEGRRFQFPLGAQDASSPGLAAIVGAARREAASVPVWHAEVARSFSADQVRGLVKKGWALPDGSYPIETVEDLKNALRLRGKGKAGKEKIRAHIVKRGKALGQTDLLRQSGLL